MTIPNTERNNRIIELWKSGLSASQIAIEMGLESRNVAIGVINRAQIRHGTIPRRSGNVRVIPKPKPPVPAPVAPAVVLRTRTALAQTEGHSPAPPAPSEGVTLFRDAEPGQCRWIEGRGMYAPICGEPVISGESWCACHYRRVYVPVPKEPPERVERRLAWWLKREARA